MNSVEKRDETGRGYHWSMTTPIHSRSDAESMASGYTIDNLHEKRLQDAKGSFEGIFIHIREVLQNFEMGGTIGDSKFDICHQLARQLSRHYKER